MIGWELWRTAFESLLANKLRSILTMLGIIMGVGSIIAIVAIGQGGQVAIVNEISSNFPQGTIQIAPKAILTQSPTFHSSGITTFSQADFQIVSGFSGVQDVYQTPNTQDVLTYGGKSQYVQVMSGPSFLPRLDQFQIIAGRMYVSADRLAHRPVIVLFKDVATAFFGSVQHAIGQYVSLRGQLLQVIGVAQSTNQTLFAGLQGQTNVVLPTTTYEDLYPGYPIYVMGIIPKSGQDVTALTNRVIAVLNAKYHTDAFENASTYIHTIENTVSSVTGVITAIIGAVAAIALVVGGVGVMNIMLVSVTERTHEIGIRVSLGASRKTILWQFLVEAMVLTTTGGVVGIFLGVVCAELVSVFAHLPPLVSWQAALGSFLFSALVGIICGIYPASKAANLNPIDSLRYE